MGGGIVVVRGLLRFGWDILRDHILERGGAFPLLRQLVAKIRLGPARLVARPRWVVGCIGDKKADPMTLEVSPHAVCVALHWKHPDFAPLLHYRPCTGTDVVASIVQR